MWQEHSQINFLLWLMDERDQRLIISWLYNPRLSLALCWWENRPAAGCGEKATLLASQWLSHSNVLMTSHISSSNAVTMRDTPHRIPQNIFTNRSMYIKNAMPVQFPKWVIFLQFYKTFSLPTSSVSPVSLTAKNSLFSQLSLRTRFSGVLHRKLILFYFILSLSP